jgi:hypothetical protein
VKNGIPGKDTLAIKIRELELLQRQQVEELKLSFEELTQSISPANIFKSAMKTVVSTPGLRSTALDTAISAGAGFLGRKAVVRNSGNIFTKALGLAVQFFVSNMVRNKMPEIKEKISAHSNGVEN